MRKFKLGLKFLIYRKVVKFIATPYARSVMRNPQRTGPYARAISAIWRWL